MRMGWPEAFGLGCCAKGAGDDVGGGATGVWLAPICGNGEYDGCGGGSGETEGCGA